MKSLTLANPVVSIKSVLPADFAEPIEVNGHIFTANIIRQALKHGRKFFGKCYCGATPSALRPYGHYICDRCWRLQGETHKTRIDHAKDTRTQLQRDVDNHRRRDLQLESKYIEPYLVRGLRGF